MTLKKFMATAISLAGYLTDEGDNLTAQNLQSNQTFINWVGRLILKSKGYIKLPTPLTDDGDLDVEAEFNVFNNMSVGIALYSAFWGFIITRKEQETVVKDDFERVYLERENSFLSNPGLYVKIDYLDTNFSDPTAQDFSETWEKYALENTNTYGGVGKDILASGVLTDD